MSSVSVEQLSGAEDVRWNLSDLYPDIYGSAFEEDMRSVETHAKKFEHDWRGRIQDCTSTELVQLLNESQEMIERISRLVIRVSLEFCTDHHNPKLAATYQSINEFASSLSRYMIFIDIELQELSDERFSVLCDAEELKNFRHFLRIKRVFKAHILSEKEEILGSEKEIICGAAWQRFFEQMHATKTYEYDGRQVSQQEVMMHLSDPDRTHRKAAAEALSAGLAESVKMNAFVFNTILSDRLIEDRIRKYSGWLSYRNMSNESSDAAVQTLIDSVVKRYDISHRYYALKKHVLGLDEFADYDRGAPISIDTHKVHWSEARAIVSKAYHEFDERIGDIVDEFFDKQWIDAALRPGKQSGAFAAATVPGAHPYILMNYTGRMRDVSTLAHELGHGIHAYLAQPRGLYNQSTPLTVAETASVFGEMLIFDSMMNNATDDNEKLALIMDKLHDICSTVFRQVSFHCFEDAIHTARRSQGELSVARFNELWLKSQKECYGESVRFPEGHEVWWSMVSHFIHSPGYVYAYAFGELLVLALYELYKEGAPNFKQNYINLLSAGGSDSPQNLLKPFGINLDDPGFWSLGLQFIDSMLHQAEELVQRRDARAS